ncbi:MAG TPA: hypothetical protein VK879_19580 [Candidatus Sulfomarinibacteraceae bacterium]|nr:hypothetical protein [Candidatus Sulfomarinibacteraceae bacterium]
MYKVRALRLALTDLWEELLLVVVTGVLGALLGALLLPLPFVVATHYHLARRVSRRRVVSWRELPALARSNLRFFALWTALVVLVSLVLMGNIFFYLSIGAVWSQMAAWVMVGLLFTWLVPQPFVPALYLQAPEQSVRSALRRAAVFVTMDPLAPLTLLLAVALPAVPLAYYAWPLLGILLPFMALVVTRMVQLRTESDDMKR